MSPVFRHGSLRLYLLKLLDEAPRHGYEVIRLLQDRFLGVYAPSPGTIYPRLARLEEEGLVTHDESDGRKVYRITEAGREELRARFDDLNRLEEEITASIRDIAREVTEDVRETVRNLREELAWAARDVHRQAHRGRGSGTAGRGSGTAGRGSGTAGRGSADGAQRPGADTREQGRSAREETHERASGAREQARSQPDQAREQARTARERAESERERARQQREEARQRRNQAKQDARAQAGQESTRAGWHEHGRHWGERGPGWGSWAEGWGGWPGPGERADPGAYRDLEKLTRQFTRELKSAAWQAQAVSEDALRDLRGILSETLDRIKDEIFSGVVPAGPGETAEKDEPGHGQSAGKPGRPEQP